MKKNSDLFQSLTIAVSETIGTVSALIHQPNEMKYMLVLGHGAGAGMTHKFMEELALDLGNNNIGTIRYNFSYVEKGKKMPDAPAVATKTTAAVIAEAYRLYPDTTLVAGGKSFGGRMTSQLMAKEAIAHVKALVFFGFPLHPAGKPATDRAAHLTDITVPMLFLQGTKDTLAEASLIEPVCKALPTATLQWLDNADHGFNFPRKKLTPQLAEMTRQWLDSLLAVK